MKKNKETNEYLTKYLVEGVSNPDEINQEYMTWIKKLLHKGSLSRDITEIMWLSGLILMTSISVLSGKTLYLSITRNLVSRFVNND